jgi:hypothetical protein
MQSSLSLFVFKIHRSSTETWGQEPHWTLNPQMASPHFPFSHIPSEIPFSLSRETKGHPPTMRTTNVRWRLKGTCIDMADPQVASCNQVWPSASNPPPSTLLKHVTQGQLKAFKGKSSPRAGPLRVGFPHSRTLQLDRRRPSHPSKRPTREASKLGRSKPPFNLWHKFVIGQLPKVPSSWCLKT